MECEIFSFLKLVLKSRSNILSLLCHTKPLIHKLTSENLSAIELTRGVFPWHVEGTDAFLQGLQCSFVFKNITIVSWKPKETKYLLRSYIKSRSITGYRWCNDDEKAPEKITDNYLVVEITFRLYMPYCAIHLFSPRWLKRSTEIPWTVHRRINAYFFLAMNINKVIEMGMSSSLFACWRIPLSSSSIPSSISPSLSSNKVLWKRPRSMSALGFLNHES